MASSMIAAVTATGQAVYINPASIDTFTPASTSLMQVSVHGQHYLVNATADQLAIAIVGTPVAQIPVLNSQAVANPVGSVVTPSLQV